MLEEKKTQNVYRWILLWHILLLNDLLDKSKLQLFDKKYLEKNNFKIKNIRLNYSKIFIKLHVNV
jgi:hypothetical protein